MQHYFFLKINVLGSQTYLDVWCATYKNNTPVVTCPDSPKACALVREPPAEFEFKRSWLNRRLMNT